MLHTAIMTAAPHQRTAAVDEERARVRQWLTDLQARFGVTPVDIEKATGVSRATIYRWLDPRGGLVASRSRLAMIGRAYGVALPGEAAEAAVPEGFRDGEDAVPWDAGPAGAPENPNRFRYVVRSRVLELSGLLPGDILTVDMAEAPRPGDIVLAQLYDADGRGAKTRLRRYDPPFLLAHGMDTAAERPLSLYDGLVRVAGVVIESHRRMRG